MAEQYKTGRWVLQPESRNDFAGILYHVVESIFIREMPLYAVHFACFAMPAMIVTGYDIPLPDEKVCEFLVPSDMFSHAMKKMDMPYRIAFRYQNDRM